MDYTSPERYCIQHILEHRRGNGIRTQVRRKIAVAGWPEACDVSMRPNGRQVPIEGFQPSFRAKIDRRRSFPSEQAVRHRRSHAADNHFGTRKGADLFGKTHGLDIDDFEPRAFSKAWIVARLTSERFPWSRRVMKMRSAAGRSGRKRSLRNLIASGHFSTGW